MDGFETDKKFVKCHIRRRRLTLIVVRHGERLDYAHRAVGKNWCKANPEQPWNPPLTEKGLRMGTQLGLALSEDILPDLGLDPVSSVYTSPFLRCRQTAAAIVQGLLHGHMDCKRSDPDPSRSLLPSLKVKVEMGLSESINENWYRSWSLPGTNGTWGYKKQEIPYIDPVRDQMDPRALKPAHTLLDWKESKDISSFEKTLHDLMDHDHRSLTSLGRDYSFAGNPPQLETSQFQRNRISRAIKILTERHCDTATTTAFTEEEEEEKNETVLLVTHGGIVTQFFVNLTGESSKKHGIGKYCSFSIYRSEKEASSHDTDTDDDSGKAKWMPLVVNRVLWNDEKKTVVE